MSSTSVNAELSSLLEEQKTIAQKIAVLQEQQYAIALEKAQALVKDFNIRQTDLFANPTSRASQKPKVPPKYRDPLTGATWTGRGMAPKWAKGDKSKLLIHPPENAKSQ